jgi:anthranilate synthase component 1
MTSPISGPELDRLRPDYDIIPIVRELSADTLTPVAAFAACSHLSDEAFLFESVERGESVGRYSFIGVAPRRRLAFDGTVTDPVGTLRRELVPLRVHGRETLPPFSGGAVGFFGYGVAGWTERIPDRHRESSSIPDATLLFFDSVMAFDHVRQTLQVISNLFTSDEGDGAAMLARAEERISLIVDALARARVDLMETGPSDDIAFTTSATAAEFQATVRRAREEIAAGEIFQGVLSQRWSAPFPTAEALTLYRVLRSVNPSSYMFLLRTRECTLVGASPEMLVRTDGRRADLRPIAGTRPRGGSTIEDLALENELLDDPKENAEHLMLVDLGRNDLGRVSAPGSVRVTDFRRVERYSHVMHLVSHVESELRADVTAVDLFLSAFPAGTVTGAPKIRAMELIDEIEPVRRGPYAGAVAYFGFAGGLDSCITIRTIVLHDDVVLVQAGAGIVFDSDPLREHEETLNKSAALRRAIGLASAIIRRNREMRHEADPTHSMIRGGTPS